MSARELVAEHLPVLPPSLALQTSERKPRREGLALCAHAEGGATRLSLRTYLQNQNLVPGRKPHRVRADASRAACCVAFCAEQKTRAAAESPCDWDCAWRWCPQPCGDSSPQLPLCPWPSRWTPKQHSAQ